MKDSIIISAAAEVLALSRNVELWNSGFVDLPESSNLVLGKKPTNAAKLKRQAKKRKNVKARAKK